jgi:hypothetical protein
MGGAGDFLAHYGCLYQDELDKDQTYRRDRPIATAAGAQQGLGEVSDRVRTALEARKRR